MPFLDQTTGTFLVPGPAGASAYEAWLALGNTGDEAAFLASQKGPQGEQGEQGLQGIQGPAGAGANSSAVRNATIAPNTFVVQMANQGLVTADPTNPVHQGKVLGYDTDGGNAGTVAMVPRSGYVPFTAANLTDGAPVFIGDGTTGRLGAPVNAPPVASTTINIWRQQVGTASGAGGVNLLLGPPYKVPVLPPAGGASSGTNLLTFAGVVTAALPGVSVIETGQTTPVLLPDKFAAISAAIAPQPQSKAINFRTKTFVLADYGAVAYAEDGASINANKAAFAALMADLNAQASGGTVLIPNQRFVFNDAIGGATTNGVHFEGTGRNSEIKFLSSVAASGLTLNITAGFARLFFGNIRVSATNCTNFRNGAVVSLRGSGVSGGVSVDTVNMICDAASYATAYLSVTNPALSTLERIEIDGQQGAYGTAGVGVYLRSDTVIGDVTLRAVNPQRVGTGILVDVSNGANNGITLEGFQAYGCHCIGVQTGLKFIGGAYRIPCYTWDGGHINAQNAAMNLAGMSQFVIKGADLQIDYNNNPQTVLFVSNCEVMTVAHCKLRIINQLQSNLSPPNIDAITVGGGSNYVLADGNTFVGVTSGAVILRNGDASVNVLASNNTKFGGGNLFAGSVTDLGGNRAG